MATQQRRPPRIGLRILKSAGATFLCLLVDLIRHGTPFYSVLAVLQCMQPYRSSTFKMAVQRTTGTLVGAAFGLLALLLDQNVLNPLGAGDIAWFGVIALTVVPVLYVTVLMKKKNASYFSCVVFMSIVINHVDDANPYLFVLNRVVDTMIGIVIGMAVNDFHLPRRLDKSVLYASALDDVLMGRTDSMTDYSRVELNRMLDAGVQFTIMTMRTPASFLEAAHDLRLRLPVILMNGAVLYDVKNNRYLKKLEIPHDEAQEIASLIREQDMDCFTNIISEDSVVILYDRLRNDGARQVYERLRKNPYRNYARRALEPDENVVYFMVMDQTEKVQALRDKMQQAGLTERYNVLCYPSDEYPGCAYLKLYHRDAEKTKMLRELQAMMGMERAVTIGSVPGQYDIVVDDARPGDAVVRMLRRLCMPVRLPALPQRPPRAERVKS